MLEMIIISSDVCSLPTRPEVIHVNLALFLVVVMLLDDLYLHRATSLVLFLFLVIFFLLSCALGSLAGAFSCPLDHSGKSQILRFPLLCPVDSVLTLELSLLNMDGKSYSRIP